MNYCADLHIHSPYSRATSPESTLSGLATWARIKGIQVVATGDFTHPSWFANLQSGLVPAEQGLFSLRDEQSTVVPVRFMLSAEISCIYKRHGAVRKVHNLVYVPDFESAARVSKRLSSIGNIHSDGRPILGLDSRDLLEIVLELAPGAVVVPAHIWTPWFSLFGSKSGFDTVEECFGDLESHIFALETGLSSDPAMNRLISGLDRFALISNSDCHSPSKLGREVNLLATELGFDSLWSAIKGNNRDTFRGTVEFFPEEGKYHADGHRVCGVRFDPAETLRSGAVCPVCRKSLTVGVLNRVLALADRETPLFSANSPYVFSLIPLPELLGELLGKGSATKTVQNAYNRIVKRSTSEFHVLLNESITEISSLSPLLGEAVRRMREGEVCRTAGYDGVYGVIRVFEDGEQKRLDLDPGILTANV